MITRATFDLHELGAWMLDRWAQRLAESDWDYASVARQLRKQGVPIEIALAVLLPRKDR